MLVAASPIELACSDASNLQSIYLPNHSQKFTLCLCHRESIERVLCNTSIIVFINAKVIAYESLVYDLNLSTGFAVFVDFDSAEERLGELHHQATRTLLNTLHAYNSTNPSDQNQGTFRASPLETALRNFSSPDTQRTLEFHVTCIVWVDIIANATFGSPPNVGQYFDYIPYLHANSLKT